MPPPMMTEHFRGVLRRKAEKLSTLRCRCEPADAEQKIKCFEAKYLERVKIDYNHVLHHEEEVGRGRSSYNVRMTFI